MRRLLTYLKPHKWTMTIATILVLFIIVVELYRPIIIGDAIDDHINGYYQPFQVVAEGTKGAVPYGDLWLTRADLPREGQTPGGRECCFRKPDIFGGFSILPVVSI